MPSYMYRVKSAEGKVLNGEIKSDNHQIVESLLVSKGYTVIHIREKNLINKLSEIRLLETKVKSRDLAAFCRQLSIVLEAGIPMESALDVLIEQTTNESLKNSLSDIYETIQKGVSLSSAMREYKKVYPELLVNMVEAGEISGQLNKVFQKVADHYEKEDKLNKKVKSAMTYPMIITVVSILAVFILMVNVLPSFAEMLYSLNVELPTLTQMVMDISSFLVSFWWLIAAVLIGIIVVGKIFLNTPDGKLLLSSLAIRLPILKGVVKNVLTARFTRTLGVLVSSGVLLIQSLEITQKVIGNVIISDKIDEMIEEIKKGKGLYAPLNKIGYFPSLVTSMIRIGEESGQLDFTLEKSADFYDLEVENSLQQLTTMIEPVIIIILAVVVGTIVLSVLYPMVSIYENIGM